jgi:hypothetical protein
LAGFEFGCGTFSWFYLYLVHVENRVCLSHGVQVAGAAWRAAIMIMPRLGDLVQRIRDGRIGWVLGGRTIGKSGDAVYGLDHTVKDVERGFLG